LESVIYLLDTDTFIFMARRSKSSQPKEMRQKAMRLEESCQRALAAGNAVGLSAITIAELEFGARKGGRYETEMTLVRRLLAPFQRYDFDAIVCPKHFGQVRDQLESGGIVIGALDMLIASHALALDATLVSNNVAHYSRINGLKTANWLSE
jgi:tRNA(fMet)-specific endonuclease VapC